MRSPCLPFFRTAHNPAILWGENARYSLPEIRRIQGSYFFIGKDSDNGYGGPRPRCRQGDVENAHDGFVQLNYYYFLWQW